VLHSCDSGLGQVAASCEHGSEPFVPKKGVEFLEKLNNN
jgi:hypothetical protein